MALPGNGLSGIYEGSELCGGNANFIGSVAAVSDEIRAKAEKLAEQGKNLSAADVKSVYETVKKNPCSEEKKIAYDQLLKDIEELPKYGNDVKEVDEFARKIAYVYTKELEKYSNPRGGKFQAGLYPVSANVPLGAQTGATPDGRLAYTPVADGVSPAAGRDSHGPTAACNSVSTLDHFIASNGTLYNMKFHHRACGY